MCSQGCPTDVCTSDSLRASANARLIGIHFISGQGSGQQIQNGREIRSLLPPLAGRPGTSALHTRTCGIPRSRHKDRFLAAVRRAVVHRILCPQILVVGTCNRRKLAWHARQKLIMERANSWSSSCSASVRHRRFRHRQHRCNAVRIADVEQHAFRNYACHFAWREVYNEQRLLAFDFPWIGTLAFHPSQDRTLVISEIHSKRDQLLRINNIAHGLDCANSNVDLIQNFRRDRRLHLRGRHAGILLASILGTLGDEAESLADRSCC